MSGAAFLFDLHPNIVVSLQSNTLQKIAPFSNYFYGVCIENDPFRAFHSRFYAGILDDVITDDVMW